MIAEVTVNTALKNKALTLCHVMKTAKEKTTKFKKHRVSQLPA